MKALIHRGNTLAPFHHLPADPDHLSESGMDLQGKVFHGRVHSWVKMIDSPLIESFATFHVVHFYLI